MASHRIRLLKYDAREVKIQKIICDVRNLAHLSGLNFDYFDRTARGLRIFEHTKNPDI